MQRDMWQWPEDRVVRVGGVWVRPAGVVAVRKGMGPTAILYLASGQQVSLPLTDSFPTVDAVAALLWTASD